MNGNGGGQATGKPCAGCVGKADNKNPKGQMPDGSDHNSGYECDRNNGIGKTNPAHTGCVPGTPPPPVCVPKPGEDEDCKPVDEECVPKPGEDEDCRPVDEECVPAAGEDADCRPVDEECVPQPVEGEDCRAGVEEERVLGRPGVNLPPMVPDMVAGVEGAPAPQAARAGAAGVLPQTGAGDLLGLAGFAGLVLMLAGGTVIAFQRRMRSVRGNE